LADEERARLQVILDELFTNIVTHGYDDATWQGRIEVALCLRDDRLIIECVDDGRPFDPLLNSPPDLDLPARDRPVGGLGIAIVRGLVDTADYSRKGGRNYLILTRNVNRAPSAG
jgi:serine/threonine-protein kinase RsbW